MSRRLLPLGTILRTYRIESVLGKGGFGVTYLASEPFQDSYVAIKEYFPRRFSNRRDGLTILPNSPPEDQQVFKWGLNCFLDEAKVLARLDHPNIIKVLRYFQLHGTAYLVMEYCDGKPLDKFIDEGVIVSPRRIYEIYTCIANALEHVHRQGIIHGDLKPSNVFVRSDGLPILLDFGSARQKIFKDMVGQVSDGYSPPEFYAAQGEIGPWSDVYGLAATFHRLIFGMKVPTATERIKADKYLPVSRLCETGYCKEFLELLDKSLNLKIIDRPQSIESIRRLLPNSSKFSGYVEGAGEKYNNHSSSSYSESFALKLKVVVVSLGIALLIIVGAAAFRGHPEKQDDFESGPKISPIPIE